MGSLLPLGSLQCPTHTPGSPGLWDVPCPAGGCCAGWGTDLCPEPASLEPSRDGETSAASCPDRNLLVLSFIPAHNVIPQRPLAEERFEEQGLNFRGFAQLAGKKFQVEQSSEHRQPFGTAKGCAGSGHRDRLSESCRPCPSSIARHSPGTAALSPLLCMAPAPAAGCSSTHCKGSLPHTGLAQPFPILPLPQVPFVPGFPCKCWSAAQRAPALVHSLQMVLPTCFSLSKLLPFSPRKNTRVQAQHSSQPGLSARPGVLGPSDTATSPCSTLSMGCHGPE